MTFDIHLYITDHKDSLPDLHTLEHSDEVMDWFSKVDDVCVHHDHFDKIDDKILTEAHKHKILQAFAVIFYPPGEMLESDEEVGEQLKKLFKGHNIKFSWNLSVNDKLHGNFYETYLELIVSKEEVEDKREEKTEKKLSLADKEKMRLGELHPEAEEANPVERDTRSLEEKILDRLDSK